ncbi:hypothetical protein BDA99DRAFT_554104 [Phascolomyces articulosus]|uniref:Uncharacterized protein n=1 Tax=Phascolomyces articulosus TaxID=60185 RepID=A0AAD5KC27_9FUNG|nr:hypothetical protein BDA99DRAFT_554104 [Phascolomyces articulosus]
MFQRLHSHKKSASCTALPVPSASSSISTQSQPAPSHHGRSTQPKKRQDSDLKRLSHQSTPDNHTTTEHNSSASSPSSSSSVQSNRSNHDWTKTTLPCQEENITVRSGLSSLLKHKSSPFPLPSVCLFSREALRNEYSENQEIVPHIYPSSVPVDQICMLVSVLESLFRTVDEVLLDGDKDQDQEEEYEHDGTHHKKCDDEDDDYRIIGLGTFKVASWNLSGDGDDMALVVILSTHYTDPMILKHIKSIQMELSKLLKDKVPMNDIGLSAFELVEHSFIPH